LSQPAKIRQSSKFIEKRGGGIHHIAVEVDDIETTLAALIAKGVSPDR